MCAPLGGPQGSLSCLGRWATSALSPVPVWEESPLPRATLLLRGSHVRQLTEGTASSLRPCPRRTTLKRVPGPRASVVQPCPSSGSSSFLPHPQAPQETSCLLHSASQSLFPRKELGSGVVQGRPPSPARWLA